MNKTYERMAELVYEQLLMAEGADSRTLDKIIGIRPPKPGTAASARADMERSKALDKVIADRERRRKALEK